MNIRNLLTSLRKISLSSMQAKINAALQEEGLDADFEKADAITQDRIKEVTLTVTNEQKDFQTILNIQQKLDEEFFEKTREHLSADALVDKLREELSKVEVTIDDLEKITQLNNFCDKNLPANIDNYAITTLYLPILNSVVQNYDFNLNVVIELLKDAAKKATSSNKKDIQHHIKLLTEFRNSITLENKEKLLLDWSDKIKLVRNALNRISKNTNSAELEIIMHFFNKEKENALNKLISAEILHLESKEAYELTSDFSVKDLKKELQRMIEAGEQLGDEGTTILTTLKLPPNIDKIFTSLRKIARLSTEKKEKNSSDELALENFFKKTITIFFAQQNDAMLDIDLLQKLSLINEIATEHAKIFSSDPDLRQSMMDGVSIEKDDKNAINQKLFLSFYNTIHNLILENQISHGVIQGVLEALKKAQKENPNEIEKYRKAIETIHQWIAKGNVTKEEVNKLVAYISSYESNTNAAHALAVTILRNSINIGEDKQFNSLLESIKKVSPNLMRTIFEEAKLGELPQKIAKHFPVENTARHEFQQNLIHYQIEHADEIVKHQKKVAYKDYVEKKANKSAQSLNQLMGTSSKDSKPSDAFKQSVTNSITDVEKQKIKNQVAKEFVKNIQWLIEHSDWKISRHLGFGGSPMKVKLFLDPTNPKAHEDRHIPTNLFHILQLAHEAEREDKLNPDNTDIWLNAFDEMVVIGARASFEKPLSIFGLGKRDEKTQELYDEMKNLLGKVIQEDADVNNNASKKSSKKSSGKDEMSGDNLTNTNRFKTN